MAIVGAILAQGAIRLIDRHNREEAAAKKSTGRRELALVRLPG